MKVWIGSLADTPLGMVAVAISERGLVQVEYGLRDLEKFKEIVRARWGVTPQVDTERTALYLNQIQEYLLGERRIFDFPIDWSVLRPFQAQALRATFRIPYGETRTYGQIAAEIGNPRAARAVGRAEATNPMPLVIPCHRVVGADGGLHGYGGAGGLKTKDWLLRLEGARQANSA